MFDRLKGRKSTAAAVLGASALFAVGGTTGAVAHGMIGSEDIRNHSVRSIDVQNHSLRSIDVANHNLRGIDVQNNTLGMRHFNKFTKDKINSGGRQQGPQGEPGQDGQDGVAGYEVTNAEARWNSTTNQTVAKCADGKVALGGGYEIDGTANGSADDTEITDNGPVYADGVANAWRVTGTPSGEVNVKAWVICADVS